MSALGIVPAGSDHGARSRRARAGVTCWSRSKRRRRRRWDTAAASEGGRVLRQQSEDGTATRSSRSRRAGSSSSGGGTCSDATSRSTCSLAPVSDHAPRQRTWSRARSRLSGYTFRDYRVLGTYRSPRVLGTQSDLLLTGFIEQGHPIELQLHATRRARRAGAPAVLERQRQRPVCHRARPDLRSAVRPRGQAAHRPAVPAGPAVDVLRLGHPRHARRSARSDEGRAARLSTRISPRAPSARRSGSPRSSRRDSSIAGCPAAAASCSPAARGWGWRTDSTAASCRRTTSGNPVIGPDGAAGHRDRQRSAGQRALLRRRRHDRSRLCARSPRHGRDDRPERLPEGRQRRDHPQRRAARPGVARYRRRRLRGRRQRVQPRRAISTSARSGRRPDSGLRYRSPIGPIRVDVGFKLDRQLLPDGSLERLTAVHISLGQAF